MHNPALHEIPRSQPAAPIPLQRDASILDWLEGTGRLLAHEPTDFDYKNEEEISELMAGDDGAFVIDDDDDDSLDLDD